MTESSVPVSFVIPVLNEHETLETLLERIVAVCEMARIDPQILFVDDGSTDSSWEVMSSLAERDARCSAIRLRRNFGKAAALSAGFDVAKGEIVITMDADLQDDPDEIPRFLEKLSDDFDVVSGWKKVRHDPWHKVLPSRVFNWLVSWLTGVQLHDHNCGFKAYRREIFDEVTLYGERHRFVPVLAAARGWRVGEIEVKHHPREFGQSKYGVSRLLKGFLDLFTIYFLTGFSRRPLHLIGAAGTLLFIGGGIGLMYLTVMKVIARLSSTIPELELHKTAVFYYCICAVLLGAQFLVAGLLAELMVSLSREKSQGYTIASRVGLEAQKSDSLNDGMEARL